MGTLVALLVGAALPQNMTIEYIENTVRGIQENTALAYNPHTPILIDDVSDFGALGFSGNGSPGNPYVIEGVEIYSPDGQYCIAVEAVVDTFYEIRSCRLSGTRGSFVWDAGVRLHGGNGTVKDTEIFNCTRGINVYSTGKVVDNCTLWDISDNAVTSYNSEGAILRNNTFVVTGNKAVHWENSPDSLIEGNSFDADEVNYPNQQLFMQHSDRVVVRGNSFTAINSAVLMTGCDDLLVTENDFYGWGYTTLEIRHGNDNTLSHCNIYDIGPGLTGSFGVYMGGTSANGCAIISCYSEQLLRISAQNSEIRDCVVKSSIQYGISVSDTLDSAVNCKVVNNTVENAGRIGFLLNSDEELEVYGNEVSGCKHGFFLGGTGAMQIYDNQVTGNDVGIITNGKNAHIYYNHIYDNVIEAESNGNNIWDDGIYKGNIWKDINYSEPLNISGGGQDCWPVLFETDVPHIFTLSDMTILDTKLTLESKIGWKATEIQPYLYELWLNGSMVDSGFWYGKQVNLTGLDTLAKGVYNVTVVLIDKVGNNASSTMWLTLTASTPTELDSLLILGAAGVLVVLVLVVAKRR